MVSGRKSNQEFTPSLRYVTVSGASALSDLLSVVAQASAIMSAFFVNFFVNFFVHRFRAFQGKAPTTAGEQSDSVGDIDDRPLGPGVGVSGVSVVIPVRNAGETIRPLLLRLRHAMMSLEVPYEALIIDDRSTDDTPKAAIAVITEERLPARVLSKRGKPGRSFSLMEGFDAARYPVLAMIDGALESPPEALPEMVRKLVHYDIVVGRRVNVSSFRAQLSATFNRLVMRLFLGVTVDVQTGIKVLWKHVYESEELNPGRWEFDMELVARALADGFRIGEHGAPFEKRQASGTRGAPLVAAVNLILSAVRLKLDMLQTARANATLKARTVQAAGARAPVKGMNGAMLAIVDWLAPLAALALFLRAVMGPAFFSSTQFLGLPGDTDQYMWFIGWTWHAIERGQPVLVTSAFNYPNPINVMDYTSVPSIGLLFGWLYSIAGLVFTFNLIIVVNYALILIFGKLTLQALGIGHLMSSAGGLLFCLMPYVTAQEVEHLNLAFIAPLFMVAYCLVRITRSEKRPGWLMGILTGLAGTLAFYTFIETTLTLTLCVAIVYLYALVFAFRPTYQLTLRLLNMRFLFGVMAPLLLVIPGVLNYLQGADPSSLQFMFTYSSVHSNSLFSLIVPSQFYLAHNQQTMKLTSRFLGNPTEWDTYLSIPFIILVVVFAVRQWSKPSTRILSLAGLSLLLLSLGPWLRIFGGAPIHVPLPWQAVLYMPILREALPARLGLYVLYLGLILVIRGVDELAKQAPTHVRPLKLNSGLVGSLMALALVAILWLPSIPSTASSMPKAANILRSDEVIRRYINQKPTLILNDQYTSYDVPYGFTVAMGVLADSNSYDLETPNNYSRTMNQTVWYRLNEIFLHDTDGKQTMAALQQYLPQLGVGKVMFLSVDNQPIAPFRLEEISADLGAPVYNNQGLVVVWNVPQRLQSSSPAAQVGANSSTRWIPYRASATGLA